MVRFTARIPLIVLLVVSLVFVIAAPVHAADMSPVEVVANVGPAVVTVINEQRSGGTLGSSPELVPVGSGSGFIISEDGYIVTNNHVVDGGDQFSVVYADGAKASATLIGADPLSDLAVVQVEGEVPGTVSFGDSNALKPGQSVLAIGSPLGAFANTVTDGIVSGLGRSLPTSQTGASVYTNLIQHDAPINPGNSGGPLFNLEGAVVGVNTIGIPLTPDGIPAQGLFFAIPSNTVKKITDQLIANGAAVYPYLGVIGMVAIDPVVAAQNDLPVDHGVYIVDVAPDGPLAQAGVQPGDIITEIAGEPIDQRHPLEDFLFEYAPGDSVELTIQRGADELTVEVTFGERPES